MSKDAPTVAAELSVQERVLLFCMAEPAYPTVANTQ
jgi:hypothetical protein